MEIRIINSTRCKVVGSPLEDRWLRNILSVEVPGAKYAIINQKRRGRFTNWDGKKKFYEWASRKFPIGLLPYVKEKAKDAGMKLDVCDERHFPVYDMTIPEAKTFRLRDYQIEAVRLCLENRNGLIHMATNAGKSSVISTLAKKFKDTGVLVLTHRKELLEQLMEMIGDVSGIRVGSISQKTIDIRPVTVAMVPTLHRRLGEDEKITKYVSQVKCICVDEVHRASASTFSSILSFCGAPLRFGFSGTIPDQGTYPGFMVRQFIGDVLIKITNTELIDRGISAIPKVTMFEINHNPELFSRIASSSFSSRPTSSQMAKEIYKVSMRVGIVENTARNQKALDVVKQHEGKSILLVVDTIEHGDIIKLLFEKHGITCAFIHGTAEERTQALEAFKAGYLKVLISSNILDEGISVNKINVLVLLAGKKSKRQLLQRIGRGLRKKEVGSNEVFVYDFFDWGSKYLERHSKKRYDVYKTEGFQIEFG